MGWKYVMFKNKIGDLEVLFPVIFPDKMVHADVAKYIRHIQPGWDKGGVTVHSAGSIEHVEVEGLGGGSETLSEALKQKVLAKKDDARVINTYSYTHGMLI